MKCCDTCCNWTPLKRVNGFINGVCLADTPFWVADNHKTVTCYLQGVNCDTWREKTSPHGAEGGSKMTTDTAQATPS